MQQQEKVADFALVTGASRGVGRAIATDLSRQGFKIIASGHDESALKHVMQEFSGTGHQLVIADLSTETGLTHLVNSVESITEDVGLRAFIHCAAQTPDPEAEATLQGTAIEIIRDHISLTASAAPILLKSLKPMMARTSRSHAILLSSDWIIDGVSGPPIFSASKSFATAVWRSARKEYLSDGIVLSTIIAGNIASYDLNWADPKWSIDDSVKKVEAELGITRISLRAIADAVNFVLNAPLCAVTELRVVPLDPDYVP